MCGSGTEDRYCGGGTARLIIVNLFLLRRTIFLSANHIPHGRHVVRDFRCGAECYERNISPSYSIYRECAFKFEKLKLMSFPEVNDVYFRLYTFT